MAKKGVFVTLEGGEGAGKSTQLAHLQSELEAAGCNVVVTREPGGTPLGERVREILLHGKDLSIIPDAELLLIFAARAQHLHDVIEPALAKGKIVLCDRFTDASYAYQGGGRSIADERIAILETWVQGDRRPDVTILFDIPVEQGLARAGRRSEPDRFEKEQQAFFIKVRDKYIELALEAPTRTSIVDASKDIAAVQDQLDQIIKKIVAKHYG
ncbi:MAG: dTMP kinase [Gammaproteobacteria bacterium]|nr:MAG: dTMP kinase [Gammaproteobacteria bacterium]